MKKRVTSLLITVLMICAMIPLAAIPAAAADMDVTEYVRLDVSAGAYIDTGIVPTKDTRVVMELEKPTSSAILYGALDKNYDGYGLLAFENGQNALLWSYYGDGGTLNAGTLTAGRHKVETDKNAVKIDGVQTFADTERNVSVGSRTMYLFAINNDGNYPKVWTADYQSIRFYSCQIYEGETLVRDFVPARKGTEVGVFDNKEGKFYAKQGGGTMTPSEVAYLRSATPASGLQSGNEGVLLDFDGTIVVSEDTTIKGLPGQSAIRIADGRNVTITIKTGVTLTVTGGDAYGRYGAGAGIEVSETSSLTIRGNGTLNAYGGNAAAGENGSQGGRGSVDETWCISGAGGNGGNGGGGAGAGIGGRGGDGGLGGKGGASAKVATDTGMANGVAGSAGTNGTAGGACGNITITNTLKTVTAVGGKAPTSPSYGGGIGSDGKESWWNTFIAFGGGGGGGGGNGYAAADTGSGGAGGGGGGGGGSGLIVYWFNPVGTCGTGHGGISGTGSQNSHANDGHGLDVEVHTAGLVSGAGGKGGDSAGAGAEKTVNTLTLKLITPEVHHLIYNGKEQIGVSTPTFEVGYWTVESAEISGNKATDVGTYTATLTPLDDYCWKSGSVEPITVEWTIEKATLKPPISYCYTGKEIGFASTDLYEVDGGKATDVGTYPVKLTMKSPNYKWPNSDDPVLNTTFDIHLYTDTDDNGICDNCGGSIRYQYELHYLDKTVNNAGQIVTEEKTATNVPGISADDAEWGDGSTAETVWYVVDRDISLNDRPVVKGNVGIILMNGKTLTANNGINVAEGNSLRIYAQSDDEKTMGRLEAVTNGVNAIGGNNGNRGMDDIHKGGPGDKGGNGGDVYFYGGRISLESSNATCIGGGNGGDGGDNNIRSMAYDMFGGDGGDGGDSGRVYFYGGKVTLKSDSTACIGGGKGGKAGQLLRYAEIYSGNEGEKGFPGASVKDCCNVFGSPVIKTGNTEKDAKSDKKYNGGYYLSMVSKQTNATASVLSEGSLTIIVGIAALVLGLVGGFFLFKAIKKKKKKPEVTGDTEKETDDE